MEINKIAPLPWKIDQFDDIEAYCIRDNNNKVVVPVSARAKIEDLEYIVEAANEYPLLKETCKKLVDQDTAHYDTIDKITYCNETLKDTNEILLKEGENLKTKLKIAITFIKQLDTKDAAEILEVLRDGVKLD